MRFWFRARFAPVGRAGGMALLLFACSPVWRPRCCWFLRPVRIVCSILFFWQTAPQRCSIRKLLQRNSWRIPMLQEVWKPFPQHSGIGLLFFSLLLHLPHVRSFISFFGAVRGAHLRSKQKNAKRRGLMSALFLFEWDQSMEVWWQNKIGNAAGKERGSGYCFVFHKFYFFSEERA